jgi:hypothetical protein
MQILKLIKKKKKIDIEAFIADSFKGLQLVTEEHRNRWQLGQEKSWAVDEATGKISFTFANGTIASAPVQVVGTYHLSEKTFTWGWKHPSVLPNLQRHAARVREFGIEYGSEELTTQQIPCTEKRAWEFTALAVLLAEANGAYCLQTTPDTFVFMTFGKIELKNNVCA